MRAVLVLLRTVSDWRVWGTRTADRPCCSGRHLGPRGAFCTAGMMTGSSTMRIVLSHGVRIGFHAEHPDLLALSGSFLPPGSCEAEGESSDIAYSIKRVEGARRYRACDRSSGEVLVSTSDLEHLVGFLRMHVQHAVAENAVDHLFVHSGAVAWRGRAILLPGPSGAGKSELVRELIRAGAAYLSDEFAALDEAGMAHPFARPLALRTSGERRFCLAREFGAETAVDPVPPGLVVVTRYERDGSFEPVPITPGESLLELLANTVTVRANPGRAIRVLRAAVSRSASVRSPRGEAAPAAQSILQEAERLAPAPEL